MLATDRDFGGQGGNSTPWSLTAYPSKHLSEKRSLPRKTEERTTGNREVKEAEERKRSIALVTSWLVTLKKEKKIFSTRARVEIRSWSKYRVKIVVFIQLSINYFLKKTWMLQAMR